MSLLNLNAKVIIFIERKLCEWVQILCGPLGEVPQGVALR
jgi:hypothetical protein